MALSCVAPNSMSKEPVQPKKEHPEEEDAEMGEEALLEDDEVGEVCALRCSVLMRTNRR